MHQIRYVIDRTNFQPDLTLRNAIRHVITNNEKNRDSTALVPVVRLCIDRIESESDVDVFFNEGDTTTSSSYGGQDHANDVGLG